MLNIDLSLWTSVIKRRYPIALLGGLFIALFFSSVIEAATVSLSANQSPPYYAGVPVELVIKAEGFDESPQPELSFDQPKNATLTLVGVSPSVSSSIQIINGRMTSSKTVLFNYRLHFTAKRPGKNTIGPFVIKQGNTVANIGIATIDVGAITLSKDQKIKLILPEEDSFVGQRIPVKIEWWVKMDRLEKLMNPSASVPLFNMKTDFQFYEVENPAADNNLTIDGQIYPATVRKVPSKGGAYAVWTVERLMVPLKPGRFILDPTSLNVDEGIRWRRDVFGRRTASQVRKIRSEDKKRVLTIRDLPTKGRPSSYAGAVGRGFSLEVAADRSVVQVGDPIKLILTLNGDAEVANASLPNLSLELSSTDFRVPTSRVAGVYDGDSKTFEISIRVLNDSVREIPPISYSWFDTSLQKYQTTQSRPIALSVRSAKMVSANDVVRATSASDEANDQDQDSTSLVASMGNNSTSNFGKRKVFSLSGADLSINKDKDSLIGNGKGWLGSLFQQIACYVIALILLIIAVVIRRHSDQDPKVVAQIKELKAQRHRIEKATELKALSDAVRRMAAVATSVPRQELDAFLSDCDAKVFAPGGEGAGVDDALRNAALLLADKLDLSRKGAKK